MQVIKEVICRLLDSINSLNSMVIDESLEHEFYRSKTLSVARVDWNVASAATVRWLLLSLAGKHLSCTAYVV